MTTRTYKENPNTMPVFDKNKGLEIGIYSLGEHISNPHTGTILTTQERINQIKEMAIMSEQAGVDIFMLGESHQEGFVSQAHAIILSAIAEATKTIKISSGATIVSTSDPVRIYENFATLDLLSNGRVEIVGGRASRVGLFKLLGYDLRNYEELFEEKFDLLLQINREEFITWQGQFRAPLKNAHIIPRPINNHIPIWRAVGGGQGSAIKAGDAGVPMNLAMLGGPATNFKNTIDAYRASARDAGFDETALPIATGGLFYVAKDIDTAIKEFYPHVNNGSVKAIGQGYSEQSFAHAKNPNSVLNIGEANQIIEKILYQHEMFGNQRYIAEVDFGGLPFDKIKENIDVMGDKIIPAIKKYTAPKENK
ncbi:LLM class flavin-dependent oxidoreductase [Vagococcus carniphilus]|uniref:LLM class flavin-dependent oxidoreductase n=1 Tax=Vagococcus carniphilus TaxID=218144 RepID=UPI003B5ADA11